MKCKINGEEFQDEEIVRIGELRPKLIQLIIADFPFITEDDYISLLEVNKYRKKLITHLIETEKLGIKTLEQEVIDTIKNDPDIKENFKPEVPETDVSFPDRISDNIASFAGSWGFILSFFGFILLWMLLNTVMLLTSPFDRFPFILLNLILSTIASVQAPIIMMSQNRKEVRDRVRSEHGYELTLKIGLEVFLLSEKLDMMFEEQHKTTLEVQEIQTDYLEDLTKIKLHQCKDLKKSLKK